MTRDGKQRLQAISAATLACFGANNRVSGFDAQITVG